MVNLLHFAVFILLLLGVLAYFVIVVTNADALTHYGNCTANVIITDYMKIKIENSAFDPTSWLSLQKIGTAFCDKEFRLWKELTIIKNATVVVINNKSIQGTGTPLNSLP